MFRLWSLAWGFAYEHKMRSALTTLATSAAVCMVVWVCSGYDSLLVTYDEYADRALGTYPLAIAPIDFDNERYVPQSLVDDLQQESDVMSVDSMSLIRLQLNLGSTKTKASPSNPSPGGRPSFDNRQIQILATDAAAAPFSVEEGAWLSASNADQAQSEVVLESNFASSHDLSVGDSLQVNVAGAELTPVWQSLRVVGILQSPGLIQTGPYGIPVLAPAMGQAFVSLETGRVRLQQLCPNSFVAISLKPSTDITAFRFGWAPKLSRYETPVQFQESIEIEEALDQAAAARNVKMQAYAATAMATLVSVLVIACTLSMGVTERSRQFALLRAIALTKFEVAIVVLLESLILGVAGLLLGLVAGVTLLALTSLVSGQILYHGITIGWHSITLATLTAIGAAILASSIPILNAVRVRPIDAIALMARTEAGYQLKPARVALAIGFISFNPLISVLPLSANMLIVGLSIGIGLMAIGFVLLTPALVLMVQTAFTGLLCRIFDLNIDLVSSQLKPHVWRTSGAAISMALGTGLFIGIQVWGYTMLQAFVPGAWAPDAMLQFSKQSSTIPIEDIRALRELDGSHLTPVVVEQPRLLNDLTDSGNSPSVTRQDNVIMVGVDPSFAFGGDTPLFSMQWQRGAAKDAVSQLLEERGCIVPEHFLTDTGLTLGDTFAVVSPVDPKKIVKYQIAASVRLEGWHWQTKMTGMRPRTHRAAALIFANYHDIASDFSLQRPTHAWFNLSRPDVNLDLLQSKIRQLTGDDTEPVGSVRSDLAAEYENSSTARTRLIHIRDIRGHIQGVARRWIWIISQVPLVTVLIASIGVLNVLLASVRSRRREYGILISIGFTQRELARSVLLEGTMVAIIACILSLGFGISTGWGGSQLAQYNSFFGGLHPPLVIPALTLVVATVLIAVFAIGLSWWPSYLVGSAKPLQLLQSE